MWEALAAVGIILIAGVVVWAKLRATPSDDSQLIAAKEAADKAARDAAEAQIKAKQDQEKKELDDKVKQVLAIEDRDAKLRAALELLAGVRAVY